MTQQEGLRHKGKNVRPMKTTFVELMQRGPVSKDIPS